MRKGLLFEKKISTIEGNPAAGGACPPAGKAAKQEREGEEASVMGIAFEIFCVVFGLICMGAGVFILKTPYEKLAANLSQEKSKRNLRARGIVIIVCGALLVIIQIISWIVKP